MKSYLLLFITLFFLVGCYDAASEMLDDSTDSKEYDNIEACIDSIYLGKYLLTEKSKTSFPYINKSKIIVSDSIGNEYVGNIVTDTTCIASRSELKQQCTEVPNHQTRISWNYEKKTVYVHFEDIGIGMEFLLFMNSRLDSLNELTSGEVLTCTISQWGINSWWTRLYVPYDNINLDPPLTTNGTFEDSIQINDKTFYDVFSIDRSYKLSFNKDKGIVGFEVHQPFRSYKLERIE